MKGHDLLEAVGGIDEEYIDNAKSIKKKRSGKNYVGWLAAAACLCILLSVIIIPNYVKNDDSGMDVMTENQEGYASVESEPNNLEEKSDSEVGADHVAIEETTGSEESADYIAMIMLNGTIYKDSYEEYHGAGEYLSEKVTSYVDTGIPSQNGEQNFDRTLTSEYFVIDDETIAVNIEGMWRLFKASEKKTSDIPKEQSEPTYNATVKDVPVDESTYSEARTYSSEILDLQNRISAAMGPQNELFFVTSSAILENPDRIHVTVNTYDEELIDILKSYNTNDVELEIEYSAGYGAEE